VAGAILCFDGRNLLAAVVHSWRHLLPLRRNLLERPTVTVDLGLLAGHRLPALLFFFRTNQQGSC
jgi:hypothetical protein